MKKFLMIFAACTAMCCLTACGGSEDVNSAHNKYENLNSMLGLDYSGITITITNNFTEEEITLESVYEIKYAQNEITVEYKVERLAEISFDTPSSDLKTTYEGTAVIKNGAISENNAGITADIAKLSLSFKEEYFENVTLNDMILKADVKNASAFLGTGVTCTDMHVSARFLDFFYNITVDYKQSGHEIEYKYLFTR